jgi:uncharacterized OsmC-like protein
VKLDDMEEFEVRSAPDWWPDAPPGYFSPQTLLLSASASCFTSSLYKVAEAMHTDFKSVTAEAEGTMAEENKVWSFDKVTIKAKIVIDDEENREKIAKAASMAHSFCPIANSLKTETEVDFEIVVEN